MTLQCFLAPGGPQGSKKAPARRQNGFCNKSKSTGPILTHFFFVSGVFKYGKSICDSFRPPGPPAEPLSAVWWPRGVPDKGFSHNFAVYWWIFTNFFFILAFLDTGNRLVIVLRMYLVTLPPNLAFGGLESPPRALKRPKSHISASRWDRNGNKSPK